MDKKEILEQVRKAGGEELASSVAYWFDSEEREFRENITLRDRVDWLEKQVREASDVLSTKQPKAKTFEEFQEEIRKAFPDNPELVPDDSEKADYEVPSMTDIRGSLAYAAMRERVYDRMRSRDKAVFNLEDCDA